MTPAPEEAGPGTTGGAAQVPEPSTDGAHVDDRTVNDDASGSGTRRGSGDSQDTVTRWRWLIVQIGAVRYPR